MSRIAILLPVAILIAAGAESPREHALGDFQEQADVGKVEHAGTGKYVADKREYRITGSGANIWGKADAFHFVFRKHSGDLTLGGKVEFPHAGGDPHRKACWMIRQSLEPDAAYVDAAVHGDGLICLQYRKPAGEVTEEIKSSIKAPATVRLERTGNEFTLWLAPENGDFQRVGSVKIELHDPVLAGLAVSSHNAAVSETAIFSGVSFSPRGD